MSGPQDRVLATSARHLVADIGAMLGDGNFGPAAAYNTLREFALSQVRVPEASRRSLSIERVEL
jgi:hypothetical protein